MLCSYGGENPAVDVRFENLSTLESASVRQIVNEVLWVREDILYDTNEQPPQQNQLTQVCRV